MWKQKLFISNKYFEIQSDSANPKIQSFKVSTRNNNVRQKQKKSEQDLQKTNSCQSVCQSVSSSIDFVTFASVTKVINYNRDSWRTMEKAGRIMETNGAVEKKVKNLYIPLINYICRQWMIQYIYDTGNLFWSLAYWCSHSWSNRGLDFEPCLGKERCRRNSRHFRTGEEPTQRGKYHRCWGCWCHKHTKSHRHNN